MRSMVKHVRLATAEESRRWFDEGNTVSTPWRGGGRVGTVFLSLVAFAGRLGDPHVSAPREDWRRYDDRPLIDGAGKISACWFFATPRGLVEVTDYWWNPVDQLSIRSTDLRAMRWFRRYLAGLGIRAV